MCFGLIRERTAAGKWTFSRNLSRFVSQQTFISASSFVDIAIAAGSSAIQSPCDTIRSWWIRSLILLCFCVLLESHTFSLRSEISQKLNYWLIFLSLLMPHSALCVLISSARTHTTPTRSPKLRQHSSSSNSSLRSDFSESQRTNEQEREEKFDDDDDGKNLTHPSFSATVLSSFDVHPPIFFEAYICFFTFCLTQ